MRVNPLFNNICCTRNLKCDGCKKLNYCNFWYNTKIGEWMYPKQLIHKYENTPMKFRIVPGGIYATEIEPFLIH
jgi:hypothetical protein